MHREVLKSGNKQQKNNIEVNTIQVLPPWS